MIPADASLEVTRRPDGTSEFRWSCQCAFAERWPLAAAAALAKMTPPVEAIALLVGALGAAPQQEHAVAKLSRWAAHGAYRYAPSMVGMFSREMSRPTDVPAQPERWSASVWWGAGGQDDRHGECVVPVAEVTAEEAVRRAVEAAQGGGSSGHARQP